MPGGLSHADGCGRATIRSRAAVMIPDGPSDLFDGLEHASAIVVAVSGGPDSMALMGLAARWVADLRTTNSGAADLWATDLGATAPRLHVATIDHGLRPASSGEAEAVGAVAAGLGLPHAILRWEGPKPATRVQEKARAARYGLLAAHARACGATHLLTGHHADDQAETVLLRLTRGSGVTGLAGMRRESPLAPGLRLVRPLLDLRKAELVAYCQREGLPTIEDPSNADPAYARTRLRSEAATWARLGLDAPALLRLAGRMADADDALEAEATRLEAILMPGRVEGRYRASFHDARHAERAVLARLLRRAIEHVVPGTRRVSLQRLEALTDTIVASLVGGQAHKATLGGARVVCSANGTIEVTPEPSRRRERCVEAGSGRSAGGTGGRGDEGGPTG